MEKSPTLSAVKRALLEQRWQMASHGSKRQAEIPKRPHRDFAPLSFIQRQMWLIDQMSPGNSAYNMPFGFRLRGRLDVAALEMSFNEIIQRHEALRTTFAFKDGEPMQLIHPELKIKIQVTALDHLPGPEREAALNARTSEESLIPFELSHLPLIRVSLFKLSDFEHVLIVNQHHIIGDGLSIGPLLAELNTFYGVFTAGGVSRPPALTVQYGDYANWQQQTTADGTAFARPLDYWRKKLSGPLPILELPHDRPRPAFQSFQGANVPFEITGSQAMALKTLGAREGCTLFMTLLAAFQVLLHRTTGAKDLIIGSPFSTRSRGELSGLIGVFLNMVPLRCDLSGDPPFSELLHRSREATLDAFSNGDLPLEILMKDLKLKRDPRRNPVFQVVLQMQSNQTPKIGDLEVSRFHIDLKFAQFDLTLHFYKEEGRCRGRFEYCSDLFEEATIQRLCKHFLAILDAIVREPDRPISSLPTLGDFTPRQVPAEFPVKISGHRIERDAIEVALREHPAVMSAVVVAPENVAGETRLVAYLHWAGEPWEPEQLRAFLSQKLPAQMVPDRFVRLPQALCIQQFTEEGRHEALTSALNSLNPMKTLEKIPRPPQSPVRPPQIPNRADRTTAPLSFAQNQMWVIDQITPGNPAYNLWIGYRLRGRLDVKVLEESFNEVIKRHEALRTTFGIKNGEPMQVIHPELKIAIKVIALDHLEEGKRARALQTQTAEESAESFDLSRLPLIRVALFKLGESEHVLNLTIHHIVSDGLSVGLFMEELNRFYQAIISNTPPVLPELSVQYGDFSLWQKQRMASGSYDKELEFWRAQLSGRLPVLELAGDKPRPARQSFKGDRISFQLSPTLVRDLRSLGARERCSFFITVLTAFDALLHRYSGAEDILVGTPIGIRTEREVESLIGNFLNMVTLRCDLSGDPTFTALLRKTRDTTLTAYLNSELPFEAMMEHLKFERDPSRNPIFQVLLTILPADETRLGDLEVNDFSTDVKVSQFDLSLHLHEVGDGYTGEFVYCTDLFHAATIKRLTSGFLTLLQAVAKAPEQRISKIPILSAPEREWLLHRWNATTAKYPAGLLHELFETQADATPQRTAVIAGTTTLTYGELEARATRVAHALRSRGVGRGQHVGLCVARGVDMLAAILGILKAGAAYLPLDPAYPEERLRFMAEDAQLAVLLSTSDLAPKFALPRARQLLLDADAEDIASMPTTRLPVDAATARPEDPAYIIYTSGSTGKPKGVVLPHRAAVNLLASVAREPGLMADDILVAVTTLSFDIAVLEMHLPLMVGARVVIATRDENLDGQALGELLDQQRATILQATPVTWRLLMESGWKAKGAFKGITGGEPLSKALAEQLLSAGIELWNLYGPTETTVYSTGTRVTNPADGITIGRPIANTIVRVLDPQGHLSPIGVPGELYIGGTGLAIGYWNRPSLTKERFVPDPYGKNGDVLYRTGDLVRWRSDGELVHLGRLDFQVKIRGHRIEVGEIETSIAKQPEVREVVVVACEETPGDKRLVAYVAGDNLSDDLADQLRTRVRSTLPEYMVPAQFVFLPALPRTQNGKIDRKGLPAPGTDDSGGAREFVVPRTPTEKLVAETFGTVLNRSKIGASDNFFDLGGNSLMAARLMLQLRTASGRDLPLRILFERQTVSALAEVVDGLALLAEGNGNGKSNGNGNRVEIQI